MKNKKLHSIIIISLIISFLLHYQAVYGHGWGLDRTSIEFDGREIDVTVELPMYYDETKGQTIKITAFDKKLKENIKNVTFLIALFHDKNMLFRNYFFASNGDLMISIIPTNEGETRIAAERDSLLGAWYATESQPIEIMGPIFDSGGLFHFEIEIRTIDKPNNIVEGLGTFVADVSMVDVTRYDAKSLSGDDVTFRIKSYFDKISEFDYDAQVNAITFKMPFDWNEKILSHIPVVHEEIHFPKNFVDFLAPSYIAKINGIQLFKSNVVVDDYTEDNERIVHFVLLQDHLQYLKQEQKRQGKEPPDFMLFSLEISDKVEFPMVAMTKNEQFQVDLSWDPIEIVPENPTKFVFTIRDASSGGPLRNSSYDFVILQNNNEIHRDSGNAQVGGDFKEFTFSKSQTGPTVIRFENIRGTGLSTEFGLVVVPEFGVIASLILLITLSIIIIINKKFRKMSYYGT